MKREIKKKRGKKRVRDALKVSSLFKGNTIVNTSVFRTEISVDHISNTKALISDTKIDNKIHQSFPS